MDFTKLKIGAEKPKKSVTTVQFAPLKEDGKPFLNGNDAPLTFDLLSLTSPEGERENRKWRKKYGQKEEDLSAADEAALDAAVARDDVMGAEFLARMIAGWNLEDGANGPVECSMANRLAFLEAFEPIAVAVSTEIVRVVNEMGNSKKA